MIQVRFTFETEFGPFSDALYLEEGHTLTEEQIEALKQERLNSWLAIVNPPPSDQEIVE